MSPRHVVSGRPVMVVLAVDGTGDETGVPPAGDPALDHAFQTAVDRGVDLWVVAESDFLATGTGAARSRNGRQLKARLEAYLRPWTSAFPDVRVHGYVTSGGAAEVVLAWSPLTQVVVLDHPVHAHRRTGDALDAHDPVWVILEPTEVTATSLA